ncbi:hypothetical protein PLICRDRAFT_441290 [Plicaturopsis crispa FD-325 SS-3]|uniref:Uncharacterized protein n=1 Tax=Plicaturopsis crispa FD-325 SS-3 TaxID=944288 RepID=A0A0C9T3D7_PLICR|nr:hypothetical protein PLICRDRAFT_441290 [Plicaturopsis crispa FD-325 SS-3]
MHRLRFLQEDRIACAVRECSIGTVPWQPEDALDSSDLTSDGWDSDSDSEEDYDEDVSSRVVRSIFLALPRFRNMRRLEITQLHVRSCTMHPSDVPSGALRVPRITYSEVNEIHGAVVPNYRWDQWMKLIGSDTIFHSMTFLGMDDLYMEESILRPLAELDPIPLVVRLNISVSRHIMSFLPSILSRLRTLEALILQPASPHVPVPPTDTFVHSSSLRSYDGPLALFRSFSCIETLAQVSLAHTMQARGPSELDPLCEVLSSAPGLHGRLTHLQIKSHLTLWRLRTLCALFPNLTVLEFRSKYASHGLNRKALIPVLYELSLPTRIEELSIRIQSKEGSMDVGAGVETPEGTALVQHLGGEYPTLQSFELSDEVFGKPWTRPFVSSQCVMFSTPSSAANTPETHIIPAPDKINPSTHSQPLRSLYF